MLEKARQAVMTRLAKVGIPDELAIRVAKQAREKQEALD